MCKVAADTDTAMCRIRASVTKAFMNVEGLVDEASCRCEENVPIYIVSSS